MPSIKDFDKDKKKKKHGKRSHGNEAKSHAISENEGDVQAQESESSSKSNNEKLRTEKRRPSQTPGQLEADVAESSPAFESSADDSEGPSPESFQSFSEPPRFELNFPGSFLFKQKVPKTFDLAERIAGDWVNGGKFESLPVGHPLAQIFAAKALVKAKTIEKNILSSTPVALAKIGLEYAKSKIKR